MQATLKIKLGGKVLEVSADGKETDIIKNLSFWSGLPTKCACGSEDISLFHKSPKDNDYYGLKCNKCNAEFLFHQFKTGGFYVKWNDKFQVYKAEDKKEAVAQDAPF